MKGGAQYVAGYPACGTPALAFQVEWSSSNPDLVAIGATTGLATAVLPGQVSNDSNGFMDVFVSIR